MALDDLKATQTMMNTTNVMMETNNTMLKQAKPDRNSQTNILETASTKRAET